MLVIRDFQLTYGNKTFSLSFHRHFRLFFDNMASISVPTSTSATVARPSHVHEIPAFVTFLMIV